jgi:hypothetical protein
MRVVAALVAEDQQPVIARDETELFALDAGEGLERRPGRAPAVRAMAVRRVNKFVRNLIVDCAAEAFSR